MESLKTIMIVITVVILGWGMLWGMIRKLYHTLLRTLMLLLAVLGAFFLTPLCFGFFGHLILDGVNSLLGAEIAAYISDPAISPIVMALCQMISAPILFVLLYFLLKLILWIPYKTFARVLNLRKKEMKHGARLTGALAGLLSGFIGLTVFVVPIFGYLNVADQVMQKTIPGQERPAELVQVLDVTQTPVAKQAYDLAGSRLFSGLTSAMLDGRKTNLQQEIDGIFDVVDNGAALLETPMSEYTQHEAKSMKYLAEDIGNSPLLSSVLSSVLSDTAEKWLAGESALGMEKPDMGEHLQEVLDAFLTVFSTSDSENIGEDLACFADIVGVLVEYDIFAAASGENGAELLASKLTAGGALGELYEILETNPRMEPVKTAIANAGVRALVSELGNADTLREEHGELLDGVVQSLKDAVNEAGTLDREVLDGMLQDVMEEYDITVDEDMTQILVDGISQAFTVEELQTLSTDQLIGRLIEQYAYSATQSSPE